MRIFLALFVLCCLSVETQAQNLNHRANPIFGTITLRAGFTPDPNVATVNAGGSTRNPISGSGCTGYLTPTAPDLKLNYTAGSLSLTFSAHAEMDLSMVVRTPDGRFLCDDDSGEGLDPLLTIESPRSGEYAIWIATYSQTDQRPQSRVTISELRRNAQYGMDGSASTNVAPATSLNWSAAPLFGTVTLRGGFTPDPHVATVNAGGSTRNPISGSGCTGYLTPSAPDLKVNYNGSLPLTFSATADRDLSMVIRTPDGSWLCDDDSGEGLDPLITMSSARSGEYAIWIATYSQTDQRPQSRVTISEIGRNARYGMDSAPAPTPSTTLNWQASALFGNTSLRAGFTPDPTVYTVNAGGSTRNPISGAGCVGWLTPSAPDLKINYTAGSLPLTFSATADMDVSMVIRTPDGSWLCDDDSGEGLDPLITINGPRSGEYAVWIATYSQTDQRPQSRVTVSELGRNARYNR